MLDKSDNMERVLCNLIDVNGQDGSRVLLLGSAVRPSTVALSKGAANKVPSYGPKVAGLASGKRTLKAALMRQGIDKA